jgi:hypothetical protein
MVMGGPVKRDGGKMVALFSAFYADSQSAE